MFPPEQDRGLDALSHVISRQKQMAIDIGNEVDGQNELLDDIIDHTDRTGLRIQRETRHINIVERKSASCWYYILIALLLVAIVVIAAVPYNGKK
uniref:t-SNARE coiled-coil homology domain-containing protein n=1 Tax=Biomphalaria glabrata TaxID=6526 RepID=A0A2C9L213_BIOGL